jgi:glutamate N-acetyltransferase/amino-acid N-acetyltransferase
MSTQSTAHIHELDSRLTPVKGGLGAVAGVRLAGVRAGIKVTAAATKLDLALVVFDTPHVAAAQITTNEIKAAPLLVSDAHLKANSSAMQVIVANSGCANACTGERGMADARTTAEAAAKALNLKPESVIVASTGVIGVPMPIDRLTKGIAVAAAELAVGPEAADRAARAIMTTDTTAKLSAYSVEVDGKRYTVGGIAKGSGMIAPSMATMLAFIATDYPMAQSGIQQAIASATSDSFNMISVDGDMSTNDCVYFFAPVGAGTAPEPIIAALSRVCYDLAFAMVRDGEGATKTLTANVVGAKDKAQARKVARAIVDSNLVRTALHGGDPNWGRIIAAAGSVGAGLVDGKWSLTIENEPWVAVGAVEVLTESDAHDYIARKDVSICLDLGLGTAAATAWGCDLSHGYVDINAHYRT